MDNLQQQIIMLRRSPGGAARNMGATNLLTGSFSSSSGGGYQQLHQQQQQKSMMSTTTTTSMCLWPQMSSSDVKQQAQAFATSPRRTPRQQCAPHRAPRQQLSFIDAPTTTSHQAYSPPPSPPKTNCLRWGVTNGTSPSASSPAYSERSLGGSSSSTGSVRQRIYACTPFNSGFAVNNSGCGTMRDFTTTATTGGGGPPRQHLSGTGFHSCRKLSSDRVVTTESRQQFCRKPLVFETLAA